MPDKTIPVIEITSPTDDLKTNQYLYTPSKFKPKTQW